MTLPWYPRDMGKYARDTKHLTMMEHGAYNLLLDHYYSNGGLPQVSNASSNASLMPDHSRLYRLCGAMNKAEQEAVDAVISMFFTLDDSGHYRQSKADEVIEEQTLKHERRVEAGRKGGQSKAGSNASSNAPQKKNQTKTKNIKPPTPKQGPVYNGDNQGLLSGGAGAGFNIDFKLSDSARDKAKAICRDLNRDFYVVMREYNHWVAGKGAPQFPDAAFIAYCKKLDRL